MLRGSDYYYQSSVGDLGQKLKVSVFVEFENKESARLGLPLPKGVIRTHEANALLALMTDIELGVHREDDALLVMPMCHANSVNF